MANILCDANTPLLELIACAKSRDRIRVDKEVKVEVDIKGKSKEPPFGMGNDIKDLKMLLKVRRWVQGRLEKSEVAEMQKIEKETERVKQVIKKKHTEKNDIRTVEKEFITKQKIAKGNTAKERIIKQVTVNKGTVKDNIAEDKIAKEQVTKAESVEKGESTNDKGSEKVLEKELEKSDKNENENDPSVAPPHEEDSTSAGADLIQALDDDEGWIVEFDGMDSGDDLLLEGSGDDIDDDAKDWEVIQKQCDIPTFPVRSLARVASQEM